MNAEYFYDIEQGTDEWHALRLGVLTASVAKDIITPKLKIAANQTVRSLIDKLAAERITGRPSPHFETYDMARGHTEEIIARDIYSQQIRNVDQCGFIKDGCLGFSPDGLVGENGFIEIKSRQAKFQVNTVVQDCVPVEYMAQIQFGFIVSGREWCDFVQYSNGMPLFVKRVLPDQEYIDVLKEAADLCEGYIEEIIYVYNETVKKENFIQTEWIDNTDDYQTDDLEATE